MISTSAMGRLQSVRWCFESSHLSLLSSDTASSTCTATPGGREMDFWIRLRLASSTRMRGVKFPRSPSPGREGTLRESFSKAELSFSLWASSVEKQEGHFSQPGKESQCPRLHESQRVPLIPGRHKQAPVCLSQTSGRVPSASQRHAGGETRRSGEKAQFLQCAQQINPSAKTGNGPDPQEETHFKVE